MNNRIKLTIGAGLVAAAVIVTGGGYYHYHVRTDTPGYTIEAVGQAIEDHDLKEFHQLVNVDSVIDSGYEGFIDGITSADNMTTVAKDTVRNFTHMLREPITLSLKTALDSYVATGNFKTEGNAGITEILERTGLNGLEIRDVKNLQVNDADRNEAFADVIIFQPELDREFPLQVVLSRGDERWKVVRVQNFREYVEQISKARRVQLEDYLAQAGQINSKHEKILREAEQKYGMILSMGNLGREETRSDLKAIIDNVFLKDWEERKQELFALNVPKDAESLQNLYMQICDVAIDASKEYSKWMEDNNSRTIKSAEEKIRRAQELMNEASALARQMTN